MLSCMVVDSLSLANRLHPEKFGHLERPNLEFLDVFPKDKRYEFPQGIIIVWEQQKAHEKVQPLRGRGDTASRSCNAFSVHVASSRNIWRVLRG